MLKAFFGLALLLTSFTSFSAGKKASYDYYIIFVGEFVNDKISVVINKNPVIANYRLENTDSITRGNLSITQYDNYISIAYNGKEIKRSKIDVDFDLRLDISVNNNKKAFKVNLKKGKIILVDYTPKTRQKVLSIEQVQEPVLLI